MRRRLFFSLAFAIGACESDTPVEQTPDVFQLVNETRGVPPEVTTHRDDWPLPNRDYENTRATTSAKIDSTNVASLSVAWRLPLAVASGPFGSMTSNPLIAGDSVFVQDMDGRVYRAARDTGEVRWKSESSGPTVGPNGVAIGWGRVFANIADTGIIAFESGSGRELWRFEPTLVSSEGVDIQPIVHDGNVYVSTVPASLRGVYLGGSRGSLIALDAISGMPRWTFDTVDSSDIWGDPSENAGGGAWYPPLIDLERKRTYWGTGNPAPWPGTPAAPSGKSRPGPNLYTSSVVALDEGGKLLWYHQEREHDLFDWDFQGSPMRIPADLAKGLPERIIGSGKTGTVVALDAESGKLLWRAKVGRHENDDLTVLPENDFVSVFPGAFGGVLTPTAYADGTVYVPVVDMAADYNGSSVVPDLVGGVGALVALDAETGVQRWSAPLAAPNFGAATVVNDLVFTSDANGKVYAFMRADGREVWTYAAAGGVNAPLAVAGDLLLIGVGVGAAEVVALRLPR